MHTLPRLPLLCLSLCLALSTLPAQAWLELRFPDALLPAGQAPDSAGLLLVGLSQPLRESWFTGPEGDPATRRAVFHRDDLLGTEAVQEARLYAGGCVRSWTPPPFHVLYESGWHAHTVDGDFPPFDTTCFPAPEPPAAYHLTVYLYDWFFNSSCLGHIEAECALGAATPTQAPGSGTYRFDFHSDTLASCPGPLYVPDMTLRSGAEQQQVYLGANLQCGGHEVRYPSMSYFSPCADHLESFNHEGLPAPGWSVQSVGAARSTPWAPADRGGGNWAMRTAQSAFDPPREEWLISPVHDCSRMQGTRLRLLSCFQANASTAGICYSLTGGLSWLPLATYTWSSCWQLLDFDLSAIADGQPALRLAFRFSSSFPNGETWWLVDDVALEATYTPPVAVLPLPAQPGGVQEGLAATVGCTWVHADGVNGGALELRVDMNGNGQYEGGAEDWRLLPARADAESLVVAATARWTSPGLDRRFELRARVGNGGSYGYSGSLGQAGIDDDWSVDLHADLTAPTLADPVPGGQPDPAWLPTRTPVVGITARDEDSGVDARSLAIRVDLDQSGAYDGPAEAWMPLGGYADGPEAVVAVPLSLPDDGEYRLEFRAWDRAGNGPVFSLQDEGPGDDMRVRVDATPPTACVLQVEDLDAQRLRATFSPTVETRFSRYELRCSEDTLVDGQDLLWGPAQDSNLGYPWASSTVIPDLATDRWWHLRLWAVDVAGNRSPASNLAGVYLHSDHSLPVMGDPTPPGQPEPAWQAGLTPLAGITVSDGGAGVDAARLAVRVDLNRDYQYQGPGEDWQPVEGHAGGPQVVVSVPVAVPADGEYRVEFRAWDLVGNGPVHSTQYEGIWDDIVVRADATPPTASTLYAASSTSSSVTLQFSPTQEAHFSRYEIRCGTDSLVDGNDRLWGVGQDPALASAGTWQTTVTGLTTGRTWYFRLWAVDGAGNRSPASNLVWRATEGAPPAAVSDLRLTRPPGLLHLAWSRPETDVFGQTPVDIDHYEVHAAPQSYFQPTLQTRLATVDQPGLDLPWVESGNQRVFFRVVASGSGPGAPLVPGVLAWGDNSTGQCQTPAAQADPSPLDLAAGGYHSLLLMADGHVEAWGSHTSGQCQVPAPNAGFVAVGAGFNHSFAVREDGRLLGWGANSNGQANPPDPNATYLAACGGEDFSLALRTDLSLEAWGNCNYGRCNLPFPNAGFVAVAAGYYQGMALRASGAVAVWGPNWYGENQVPEPNENFTAIAAGHHHCLALRTDGSVAAWGYNAYGQCDVPSPNQDFVAIAAGGYHSLGLKSDGTVVAWGSNWYGESGPPPASLEAVTAIAAGYGFSAAIGLVPQTPPGTFTSNGVVTPADGSHTER